MTTITKKVISKTSVGIPASLIARLESKPHLEGLELDIPTLEKVLKQAINDYYNIDTPLLTDETYDILETILREKKPSSKLFEHPGAPVSNSTTAVKLPYYLGSLDKVKPNEKSLTKWLSKHNTNILISEKLDGLSALLVITDPNDLSSGYRLYKHGDGYEGQDISHLLAHISLGHLNTPAISKIISGLTAKHIALRGEIIIKTGIYETKYNKMYPKARSLVAGIVNAKTPDKRIIQDMEIIFYELIQPQDKTFLEQFETLASLGFNTAKYKLYPTLVESQLPEILIEFKRSSEYEIDGLVLDDSSKVWKRVVKDNPDYAVAFKMYLDEQIATTTVTNVEYNVSKHGTLAPRIEYVPVMIKGDNHQYTTGFNLKYIVDNKINIGTVLKIIKSGDVIPYIYEIVQHSREPMMPQEHIKWHWNETRVDGIVDNMDENADVRLQKLIAFFKVLQIDGVGEGVVKKFVAAGYDETQVILELTPDVIASIEGFQLRSATNVYTAIHKVIDKPIALERVMMASGVFTIGLGEKKFKMILDNIPDLVKQWQLGKITKHDIIAISGFSDKTADILIQGMPKFLQWLATHSMIKIQSSDYSAPVAQKGNKFAGMIAVFTGVRDTNLEQQIIDGGGNVASAVSGKTTVVVAKDVSENSGKISKARALGIEVVGIDEFREKYLK